MIIGGLGQAGFQYTYFTAVSQTGVALSTAIAIGLAPILTGTWVWLHGQRPSRAWLVATPLAVIAMCLLVFGGTAGTLTGSLSGIAWAVGASFAFSAQIVAIESIRKEWSNAAGLAWMFAMGATVMLPLAASGLGRIATLSPAAGGVLIYLGVVTGAVAYLLFAWGTKIIGRSSAATISLLEPAGAIAIAVILLGERQTTTQILGMILLICGIAIVACAPGVQTRRRRPRGSPDAVEASSLSPVGTVARS